MSRDMKRGIKGKYQYVFINKGEFDAVVVVHADNDEFAWYVLGELVKDARNFYLLDV